MTQDPYAPYLQQADALFAAGDIIKAGQIWQAILKREPAHGHAREGLLKVKAILDRQKAQAEAAAPVPEPQAPPPPPPAPSTPAPSQDEVDLMIRQGCTLYDMGQVEDALRKWEEVLALVPDHPMALDYTRGARKELGLGEGALPPASHAAATEATRPPSGAPASAPEAPGDSPDIEALLRGAAQLYDMGVVEEAMDKWRQVLELDPNHAQAQTFIRMAEKEEAENRQRWAAATTAMGQQTPAAPFSPSPTPMAEATVAMPTHAPAPAAPQEQATAVLKLVEREPDEPPPPPKPVALPAKVTAAAPPKRSGLQIPDAVKGFQLPPWVLTPVFLGSVAGGILVLSIGIHFYRSAQRDQRLKADVAAALLAAKAPAAKATAIADLTESPAAILSEGQAALKEDPLRAYHRAKEVLRRTPNDGAAAQLLERARLALVPLGATPVGRAEAEAAFKSRDLDKANRLMDSVLRADPDNGELLLRATRILSLLAQSHAANQEWDEAREALKRARALTPQDKTWSSKLMLLDRIKDQPRQEQPGWIALL